MRSKHYDFARRYSNYDICLMLTRVLGDPEKEPQENPTLAHAMWEVLYLRRGNRPGRPTTFDDPWRPYRRPGGQL